MQHRRWIFIFNNIFIYRIFCSQSANLIYIMARYFQFIRSNGAGARQFQYSYVWNLLCIEERTGMER